jgi:hypothetical protein
MQKSSIHAGCGEFNGGEGGIRTRGKFYPSYAFQAYDLNRSSTSPGGLYCSAGGWWCRVVGLGEFSGALYLIAARAMLCWAYGRFLYVFATLDR